MNRQILVVLLILVGIALGTAAFKLHGPAGEARRSCAILRNFADHVEQEEWPQAQAMLKTDPAWFRIEDGKVLYWNRDITDSIASAQPKFWKTFKYYLPDRHMGDTVIFQASSRADYAKLKDGTITFVKIP